VATPFTAKYLGTHTAVPPDVAARNLIAVLDSLTPVQTGGFFDAQGRVVPW
ncbi:MAG: C factor, cell signaling protein, partial [Rhodobacter sp.]|nr:C factor, cell signaling protein [Rhodobacter sp.]